MLNKGKSHKYKKGYNFLSKSFIMSVVALMLTTVLSGAFFTDGTSPSSNNGVPSVTPLSNVASQLGVNYTLFLNNNTLYPGNVVVKNSSFAATYESYDPVNGNLYVVNSNQSNPEVAVVNISSNKVIDYIGLSGQAFDSALNPSSGYLYVLCSNDFGTYGNVTIINTTTNTILKNISAGSNPALGTIAYDSSNGNIYYSSLNQGTVTVINGSTNAIMSKINVGFYSNVINYDPSNGYLYISNQQTNNLTAINGATNKIVSNLTLPGVSTHIVYDSSNGYLYMGYASINNISIVDPSTNSIVGNISTTVPTSPITYLKSTGYLYATESGSNNVYAFNPVNKSLVLNFTGGDSPVDIVKTPLNNYLYISNVGSSSISLVEIQTLKTAPNYYNIVFNEKGLPAGTSWKVTFNGTTSTSTNSTVTFSVQNGNYSFTIDNLTSYYTMDSSGKVTVNASSVTDNITFVHYAYIDVKINPANATLLVNGVKKTVAQNGTLNLTETTGTYNITVEETGYTTFYDNFTLSANQTTLVNATLNNTAPTTVPLNQPPLSGDYLYFVLIGVGLVAVFGLIFVAYRRRKKEE